MEMELKLLIDPEKRALVEKHKAFKGVESKSRTATTTYFDTPDLALFRLGACLRVRQSDDGFVQTVKLQRSNDQIGSRAEWEWPVESAAPDLAKLDSLPDEAAEIRALAGQLHPVFTTLVERTSWLLHLGKGTTVEAVIDRGTIRTDRRSVELSEVELELKHGPVAPLYRLAIDLCERIELRWGAQSKSDRGYALVADKIPDRPERPLPAWDPAVTIGVAFPRLVHAALRDLAAEITLASAGDVEGVHRMRAAIRKLRSVLVLFGPYLDRRAARGFNQALRSLGGILGRGRDWDVFLTETLVRVEKTEQGAAAAVLRAPAEERCREAHVAIDDAMRAHQLTGLILGLGAWTVETAWLRKCKAEARFADLVPALLSDLDRKARKRAKTLDMDEPETLHDLRKALKKLRYCIEYVGSLFEREALDHHVKAMKSVLALLGDINDAEVTAHRVEDIATTDKPELMPAAAILLHETDQRRSKAMRKLPKKLEHLLTIEPFWV